MFVLAVGVFFAASSSLVVDAKGDDEEDDDPCNMVESESTVGNKGGGAAAATTPGIIGVPFDTVGVDSAANSGMADSASDVRGGGAAAAASALVSVKKEVHSEASGAGEVQP